MTRAWISSKVHRHGAGLLLSGLFAVTYLCLGLRLNSRTVDTTDNYLDADNYTWMRRIAWADGDQLEMRAPHPFAFFIFRPIGSAAALAFGDPFVAAVVLNSVAGGLCVYLAWLFVLGETGHRLYAALTSALLGLSTSHVWFGSIVESYIFSAAALLGLVVVLQKDTKGLAGPVLTALVVTGITVSNAVQTFVAFLVARRNFRTSVVFAATVLVAGIALSLLHAAVYPSSLLPFEQGAAQTERGFAISIWREPGWRAAGRLMLVARTMAIYTIVAPQPYVFTSEVGGSFPRFNFFRIAPGEYAFSAYEGWGTLAVAMWAAFALAAALLFVKRLRRERRADPSLAFLLCLAFNFALHLFYGYEPFLYSPDWAYALVLFVALAARDLAVKPWYLGGLGLFLLVLAWNQALFMKSVLDIVQPYMP